jgi:transposase
VVEVDEEDIYIPYVCALATVSVEGSLEYLETYNTAVNSEIFCDYIRHLHVVMKHKPFALFMDNLKVHSSPSVKAVMCELNITAIMNVYYSPEYNPIEGCFSIVKNHYKRERLNAMRNKKPFVVQRVIH